MMKNIISTTVFLYILLFSGGCTTSIQKDNGQSQAERDSINHESKGNFELAIELQRNNGFFLSTKEDTLIFQESAALIKKAISLDSLNLNYYVNLSQIYFRLGSNTEAIQILDEMLAIDPDNVEAITAQGFIFEKTGNISKANIQYKKAIELYNEKTFGDRINSAFLVLLLHGKEKGIQELIKIKEAFPDEDLSVFQYQFKNFNRKQFIDNSLN